VGIFRTFEGGVESMSDDFSDAEIQLTVDVNSIDSNNEARDIHRKSSSFFFADQFPEMKFQSRSFKKQKGSLYKLTGELTMRGVTKNVAFDVEYLGEVTVNGIRKVAFKAETRINRFDFDTNWNTKTPDEIQIVDERVSI
jgi:polyisoprenoid-binding protein YceI